MKYPEIINLLDNTPNQQSKFRIENQVETNDDARRIYNNNRRIKFKTSMLRSSDYTDYRFCGYSDAYMLINGIMAVTSLVASKGNNNI